MKTFLRNMNPVRFFLILSVVGSVALAARGWSEQQDLDLQREHLESRVEQLAARVQQLAQEHTKLTREYNREGIRGQENPESYIRACATADKVNLGDVRLTQRDTTPTKGVVDKKVQIRPNNRERDFPRSSISNFLYKLEAESRRVKVTRLQVEVAANRLAPHEIPPDRWKFEAEITSRQPVGE